MAQSKSTTKSPPYLPYKTFTNVLEILASSGIPTRIDKSLFRSQSGAMQSQIISSLEFLNLIDSARAPTAGLEELVEADEAGRADILAEILQKQYRFIFTDGFNLEKTTNAQLEEVFRNQGISGETVRKCITFFLQACKATKIRISPHISAPRKTSTPRRKPRPPSNPGAGAKQNEAPASNTEPKSIEEMLLDKFPEFDPSWPEEQQSKWFDAFNQFQKRLLSDSQD